MPEKDRVFCWSCGKPLELCTCGNEQVPFTIRPPETLPPKYEIVPELESLKEIEREPVPRTCCNCGKTWKSVAKTIEEWTDEKCPYCGAE